MMSTTTTLARPWWRIQRQGSRFATTSTTISTTSTNIWTRQDVFTINCYVSHLLQDLSPFTCPSSCPILLPWLVRPPTIGLSKTKSMPIVEIHMWSLPAVVTQGDGVVRWRIWTTCDGRLGPGRVVWAQVVSFRPRYIFFFLFFLLLTFICIYIYIFVYYYDALRYNRGRAGTGPKWRDMPVTLAPLPYVSQAAGWSHATSLLPHHLNLNATVTWYQCHITQRDCLRSLSEPDDITTMTSE